MNKLTWSVIVALILGSAGCQWKPMQMTRGSDKKSEVAKSPAPTPKAPVSPDAAPKAPDGPSPVEQALELSRKLKQAELDVESLRKENKDLIERNAKLTTQATKATMELDQAQKELQDANVMLREMKTELNNWKANVLGFREEMRTAAAAQLDGTRRILRLLGVDEASAKIGVVKPGGSPATKPSKAASMPKAGTDGAVK